MNNDTGIGWTATTPSDRSPSLRASPLFMTPDTKFLLRKNNRLMRQERTEEASAIAIKVGRAVARFSSRELRRLDNSVGTKKLWECVHNLTNPREESEHRVNFNAEELNNHYASISTDPAYQEVRRKLTANPQLETFSKMNIFTALDRLRPTAEGIDRLPAWYLRLLAPICARSLESFINLSLGCSFVPQQWKLAVIHSAPKNKTPQGPSDYRPISVVPILSRLVERLGVSTYLYPALTSPPMADQITDQFAFRPSGSTTATLIDLLQQITSMLQRNDYVLIVSTDFTRAFDTVRHSTLMQKMDILDLPDNIYNWIANYFKQRGHLTKIYDTISAIAFINASIIQGSVIGPPSYVVAASATYTLSPPEIPS